MKRSKERGWSKLFKTPDTHDNLLRPMRNPVPAWSGVHGGVIAISQDFDHHLQHLADHNPQVQKWAGVGYTPKFWEAISERGVTSRVELARLTSEQHRGRAVHVPPFYGEDKAKAVLPDGTPTELGEVVIDYFQRHLTGPVRLPAPEIYSIPRVIESDTLIRMVAPPGAVIHYTIDGSDPDRSSPRYTEPFRADGETVVKAIAIRDGFTDSGVNAAHFVEGPAVPQVVGPQELPVGQTGEPYAVTFESDVETPKWLMHGELVPHVPHKQTAVFFPNGMRFDSVTGRWEGTPTIPGRYWIQVWVNRVDGTLAGYRNCYSTVTGDRIGDDLLATDTTTEEDPNTELVRLSTTEVWHRRLLRELALRFQRRGVRFRNLDEETSRTILIDRRDRVRAIEAVRTISQRSQKLPAATEWLIEPEASEK